MKKHIFPLILIVLQTAAGLVCASEKDVKMAVYWIAAAVLNISVTF